VAGAAQQERLDRRGGEAAQVVALAVAAVGVAAGGVAAPLQLQVGGGGDAGGEGTPERPHRRRQVAGRGGVADPHEPDGDDRPGGGGGDVGGERRLPGRGRVQVTPALQDGHGVLGSEVELGHQRPRARLVQLELELGDDAEVAAAAAQPPEQLAVAVPAGSDVLAVGGDEREGDDVVAGQAVLAGQPAHAAAEGEPADAGVGDVAGGGGQAVRLGGAVERAEQGAALDAGAAAERVHPYAAHQGQVDHEAVVGDGEAGGVVPAAAYADL